MNNYIVDFDHIGRDRFAGEQTFSARDADHLAEQIWYFARRRLASYDFNVNLDLDEGKGWIEGGRFGTFSVIAESA